MLNNLLPWLAVLLFLAGLLVCLRYDRVWVDRLQNLPPRWHRFFTVVTEAGRSHWYLIGGFIFAFAAYLISVLTPDFLFIQELPIALIEYFAFIIFLAVAISGILVNILKPVFAHSRPRLWIKDRIHRWFAWDMWRSRKTYKHYNSFPSGHSATATAVAMSLQLVLPPEWWPLKGLLWAFMLLVAATRALITVHYASEVWCGAWLGALIAWMVMQP